MLCGMPETAAAGWELVAMGVPGNRFQLCGEAVWQLLPGDWFDACVIYRDWVRKQAKWYPAPGADGRSLRATWRRFVAIGDESGHLIEPGFEVSITWRIEDATLTRTETLTATRDVAVRRLSLTLSSTATEHEQVPVAPGNVSAIRLSGRDGMLDAYPEFERPLGPPQSDAAWDGLKATREFAYASVFVDLVSKLAKIDWRKGSD